MTVRELSSAPPRPPVAELLRGIEGLDGEMAPQSAPGVWKMVFEMLPPPCDVLEVGAGRGGLSSILHANGYRMTCADLNPQHFRAAGLTCARADLLEPLPFATGSFDLVIGIEVIEHLENPWRFVRESLRVLRDKGQFIVTTPNVMSLPSRLSYLFSGQLHYFRLESFVGCYHVTPIFDWAVERCLRTVEGRLAETRYSRPCWPRRNDVPRREMGLFGRMVTSVLPNNAMFGEIIGYRIVKEATGAADVAVGVHTS